MLKERDERGGYIVPTPQRQDRPGVGPALSALIERWRKEADKDWHTGHDDVDDGVWSFQHEANGRAAARKKDADELEAALSVRQEEK